ncbi:MAG: HAD-IA family hydrolase [Nitrospinota bacterium]|jgi:phosphoglycolate phosphatase|nr:HAD-IA family hydrolase [Nitrospinota bacterium]MDP7581123.1 HAD-IA family hydrolase [Nitrospinota bacterium]HJN02044.1 HAD-IA family hydrolase [Nitrospinota bacterium]
MRLIIFDLDGTLIDSKNDIADSVNYTLKRLHLPSLQNSLIYSYVGNGVLPLLEKVISCSNKKSNLENALKVFRKHYEEHLLDSTRLYPGVMEILKHFSDVNMGLVSNKPERFVKKILKGLNVDCFFPVVIGGDTLKTKKPDPEGVNMIRNRFGADLHETVIVGDGGVDIETGKEAGIHTCGVSYGLRDRKELVEAGAEIIIDDILELKNHFNSGFFNV